MTANTSGVGVPLLASVPLMKHSPNSELTRLHAILSVGLNGSIHPDAEAMIVRGAKKKDSMSVQHPDRLFGDSQ